MKIGEKGRKAVAADTEPVLGEAKGRTIRETSKRGDDIKEVVVMRRWAVVRWAGAERRRVRRWCRRRC